MSRELTKRVDESMRVDGCEFAEDALVFRRVDAQVLEVAGGLLQKWERKASWYWGDYMVAYCDFQFGEEEAERRDGGLAPFDDIVRSERLVRYAAQYAEIAGVEVVTLKVRKQVAAFFKPDTRVSGLDWEHHRIAKWGSGGDLAVAQELLALAKSRGWKASRLKAHINATRRGEQEPEEPVPQLVLPMEIVQARRYATAAIARVPDMSMDEAKVLLNEMAPLLRFARALADRIGIPDPGKESLSDAA